MLEMLNLIAVYAVNAAAVVVIWGGLFMGLVGLVGIVDMLSRQPPKKIDTE